MSPLALPLTFLELSLFQRGIVPLNSSESRGTIYRPSWIVFIAARALILLMGASRDWKDVGFGYVHIVIQTLILHIPLSLHGLSYARSGWLCVVSPTSRYISQLYPCATWKPVARFDTHRYKPPLTVSSSHHTEESHSSGNSTHFTTDTFMTRFPWCPNGISPHRSRLRPRAPGRPQHSILESQCVPQGQ